MRAVTSPTMSTGRCPIRWKRPSNAIGTACPRCRSADVGSTPSFTVTPRPPARPMTSASASREGSTPLTRAAISSLCAAGSRSERSRPRRSAISPSRSPSPPPPERDRPRPAKARSAPPTARARLSVLVSPGPSSSPSSRTGDYERQKNDPRHPARVIVSSERSDTTDPYTTAAIAGRTGQPVAERAHEPESSRPSRPSQPRCPSPGDPPDTVVQSTVRIPSRISGPTSPVAPRPGPGAGSTPSSYGPRSGGSR